MGDLDQGFRFEAAPPARGPIRVVFVSYDNQITIVSFGVVGDLFAVLPPATEGVKARKA